MPKKRKARSKAKPKGPLGDLEKSLAAEHHKLSKAIEKFKRGIAKEERKVGAAVRKDVAKLQKVLATEERKLRKAAKGLARGAKKKR